MEGSAHFGEKEVCTLRQEQDSDLDGDLLAEIFPLRQYKDGYQE